MGPRFPSWSLPAIEQWRGAFAGWLSSGAISESLATVLLEVLGERSTSSFERYPYHLSRYSGASLHAVMLWRAGIVDFLSDVWDTMGEADFDIEECQRVCDLLMPADPRALCPLCLEEQGERHFDACAVQLAWRGTLAGDGPL